MPETTHAQPLPEPQTPLWLPALGAVLFAVAGIGWTVLPDDPPPAAPAPVAAVASVPPPAPTTAPVASVAAAPPRPTPAASGSAAVRPVRPRPVMPHGAGRH